MCLELLLLSFLLLAETYMAMALCCPHRLSLGLRTPAAPLTHRCHHHHQPNGVCDESCGRQLASSQTCFLRSHVQPRTLFENDCNAVSRDFTLKNLTSYHSFPLRTRANSVGRRDSRQCRVGRGEIQIGKSSGFLFEYLDEKMRDNFGGLCSRDDGHSLCVLDMRRMERCLFQCRSSPRDMKEFDDYIDPAKAEPIEADDEDDEEMTKFDRVVREAEKVRKSQQEEYIRNKPIFMKAIGLEEQENGGEEEAEEEDEKSEEEPEVEVNLNVDDEFYSVDRAVANKKKQQLKSRRNTTASSSKSSNVAPVASNVLQELQDGEDLEEEEADEDLEAFEDEAPEVELDEDLEEFGSFGSGTFGGLKFEEDETEEEEVKEPVFRMTLGELLDEARVTPISVEGDLDVELRGIQHDSRQVSPGDLFVCVKGLTSDGHDFASQAIERGAVAIISSSEVPASEGLRAVVIVEDTNEILSGLAGAFYAHPSQSLTVVGITGTNGKTTTSYLLRSMYEAMGMQTGLLGTINYFINSKKKLEAPNTTPDAVYLQKLMATMVHNGTEACIMEVSSHAMVLERCKEVDFDIAVFTNLSRDHMDFHKTEEEYKAAKGKLFAKMIDPERHRKVVNIDDPHAPYFVSQGNPDVPVVTFGMENVDADVFPLEVQLSLFETELLVRTPKGNVEISSGLLGRHNVYNILGAVAVGIAVEAPLEDIVRGIEEVDAVPGRCELIDEEQAFAVIVDYAHSPDALGRLLDTVRECGPRRVVTVVGCGGDRDRGKRPIMAKIATDKSDVCIFTADNPRTEDALDILDDMLSGVGWSMEEYVKWGDEDYYPPLPNGHRLFVYDIRSIAVRAAVAMGEEGDAVVVAGKGHETYQIIGKTKEYFDDREECRDALQHVDALHAAGVDTSEVSVESTRKLSPVSTWDPSVMVAPYFGRLQMHALSSVSLPSWSGHLDFAPLILLSN